MRMVDFIAAKRDGQEHTAAELHELITRLTADDLHDYQLSAWLMAVLWRGMTERETITLTEAMIHSGEVLDLHDLADWIVDKHSTGGVGDKTTLVVAPLVAAAGLPVVKMSGRGLGYTGGTLDKLEAIPGFNVNLDIDALRTTVQAHGIALAGQTAQLAPADGKLYALRDVTATVPSLPLIASSIMSKKIASGADAIALDVKVGRGAFMETLPEARALAELMMRIGQGLGKQVSALLADMSQPLGLAVGNALEVAEAVRTLAGCGPADLVEHCLVLSAEMLLLGKVAGTPTEARQRVEQLLSSGAGLDKFREWVAAQQGDPRVADDLTLLPSAPVISELVSSQDGYIQGIDAREVGLIAGALGAGRERKGEAVDPAVGIVLHHKAGEAVSRNQPLAAIHARKTEQADAAARRLDDAIRIGDERVAPPPTVYEVLCAPALTS
ncbi:MAG: thymidine phosphorylase [Chloroflexi bacterium]|nr:thymidine phosphorylase [Chloroflexota bacterium]